MNPLEMWNKYLKHRIAGAPLPDDVLAYLDSVALHLTLRRPGELPENNPQIAVEALGLKVGRGESSAFKKDQIVRRDRALHRLFRDYRSGELNPELAGRISAELYGQERDARDFKDDRDFYSWAGNLFEIDGDSVERILRNPSDVTENEDISWEETLSLVRELKTIIRDEH